MKEKIKINDPEIEKLYKSFTTELKGKLLDGFNDKIKIYNRFINAFKIRLEKVTSTENKEIQEDFFERVQMHRNRKKELLDLINKRTGDLENETLNLFFSKYFEVFTDFSSKLQNTLIRKEKEEKYDLKLNGKPLLFFRKALSNIKLWLAYKASAIVNLVRKIFRKPAIDYTKYRKRRIPFRPMAKYFLITRVLEESIKLIPKLMEERNSRLIKLWEADDQLEAFFYNKLNRTIDNTEEDVKNPELAMFDELKKSGDLFKKELIDALDESIDRVFLEFDSAIQKVDTIELSKVYFHARDVNRQTKLIDVKFSEDMALWNNSALTLYDDWCMDVEITLLYYSVFDEYYKLKNKLTDFIANNLSVNFNQLEGFFNKSAKRLEDAGGSVKTARETLLKEREVLNKELIDKILTQTNEKLTGNFIDDIDKLYKKTLGFIENVSDKRGFVKNKNYLRGVKDSEISTISPRELLNFEALPHFEKKLEQIKTFVNGHLEKARINLLSLGTVSDFNLESAALLLDQKKNAAKNAIKIASEGYERALSHLKISITLIDEIKQEPLENLKGAINEFNAEIQKLKNTDNILELNLRIARIKTIERSKKARQDIVNAIKTFIPKGINFAKTYYQVSFDYLISLKNRIGVSTEKTEISFELSEFISETETYLKKLPFVYQRLYHRQPTDEDRFFVNRNEELDILKRTFEDWQKERFVSVAILGEKGSGITSFINKFIRSIETETTIIRETLDKKIYTNTEYITFFKALLNEESFITNDDIIEYLNTDHGYKIIILENMHHLFLKQIGGFECIKLFFDLMAHTTKKVLWICGYTRHSWDYLDHTVKISDYYIRNVTLTNLSDQTIEEIIFSRNLLSGYKLIFETSPDHLTNKSFIKKTEDEKQHFLQKEFFSNLNKICNGNISLALLYWLRSTRKVTDESITIANLHKLDLSFVRAFSADYLFILHAMLIHDGLTLGDYSKIFNISPYVARNTLIPMLEKGLLIRPKEKFNINPIIFNQVVILLSSKNFIN